MVLVSRVAGKACISQLTAMLSVAVGGMQYLKKIRQLASRPCDCSIVTVVSHLLASCSSPSSLASATPPRGSRHSLTVLDLPF